ncbi:RNA polymerase sigma factor for flagellar operon FliA [Prauserella sediminis]|uniref:RNA polymerase sigma factor n=1 Tax=Prauserella sediminis TaxID=577680 RepID=A0A839XBP0_9PSEU|nr:FliA/WhiG family RNA polymerase sigma factor [Prauserella sediminis]MBB3661392.1 RNA polymerase sigma factor for flagellar operon FliA [Prauserella sediminis]
MTSTREPADAPTAEPPVGDAAPASYGAPGTDGVPGADAASGADATAGTDAAAGTDAPVAVDATGTDAAAAAAAVTDTPVAGVDRADGDAPASGPARPLPADANGSGGGRAEADAAIKALWHEFATEPSQRVRDRLVLHYAPLVKYVAGRVGTGLPTHVDVADLIQSGIFGLVDAIEKFDPDRGLRFETYAMQRIRGAILDDLRSQDWVPRVVRSRAREVERTLERLGARLGRTPTDAEVAAELGISLGELHDLYGQLRLTSVVALETLVAAGRDSESVVESLPDDEAVDPAAVLVDRDNRKQLADAIAQLNERDRIVVSLYYFESLTLAEIGKVLGVTESRVSQLHTRAVLRLRAKLQEQSGT